THGPGRDGLGRQDDDEGRARPGARRGRSDGVARAAVHQRYRAAPHPAARGAQGETPTARLDYGLTLSRRTTVTHIVARPRRAARRPTSRQSACSARLTWASSAAWTRTPVPSRRSSRVCARAGPRSSTPTTPA